jgi:ribosomal protein S18 acetylase RimI-like enzyme
MAGVEGHRGWLNYLAVSPDRRRRGYGRQLMAEVESRVRAIGCPKVNLQVRRGNGDAVAFYTALGYAQDDLISLGRRLERDDA